MRSFLPFVQYRNFELFPQLFRRSGISFKRAVSRRRARPSQGKSKLYRFKGLEPISDSKVWHLRTGNIITEIRKNLTQNQGSHLRSKIMPPKI